MANRILPHAGELTPVEIGVVYPQTELRGDPVAVRSIGGAAAELGFAHIWIP